MVKINPRGFWLMIFSCGQRLTGPQANVDEGDIEQMTWKQNSTKLKS